MNRRTVTVGGAIALAIVMGLGARRASADAVVTLRGGSWVDYGWRPGTPTMSVAGVELVGTATVTRKVPASGELVRATVTIDGKDGYAFLIDLRDGHHYTVEPDPCCMLVVGDADDGLAARARCGTADRCPAGTVGVDKFVFRKEACGERPTCAPPARLRVQGAAVTIAWNGEAAQRWGARYQEAPTGRENPQRMVVRRAGRVVWDQAVVLHLGARYTLRLPATGAPHLVMDR